MRCLQKLKSIQMMILKQGCPYNTLDDGGIPKDKSVKTKESTT